MALTPIQRARAYLQGIQDELRLGMPPSRRHTTLNEICRLFDALLEELEGEQAAVEEPDDWP